MHRQAVNKRKSANSFRKDTRRTKTINIKAGPMRGGIRL